MKNLILVALAFLAGCQSYSDTPSRVLTVSGDYVAIADCTYVKIGKQGAWRREEMPSLRTVVLKRGDDKYAIGNIEFVGNSSGTVKVEMKFMTPVQGPKYYPDMTQKMIEECVASTAK
jgi:hypothetical protein